MKTLKTLLVIITVLSLTVHPALIACLLARDFVSTTSEGMVMSATKQEAFKQPAEAVVLELPPEGLISGTQEPQPQEPTTSITPSGWDKTEAQVVVELRQKMADKLGVSVDQIQFQSFGFDSVDWDNNKTVAHITLVGPKGENYTYLTDGSTSVLTSTKAQTPDIRVSDPVLLTPPAGGTPQPQPQEPTTSITPSGWDKTEAQVVVELRQKMADKLGVSVDQIQFQSFGFDSVDWDNNKTVAHITLVGPKGENYTYLTDGSTSVLTSTKAQTPDIRVSDPVLLTPPAGGTPQPQPQEPTTSITPPGWNKTEAQVVDKLKQRTARKLGVSVDQIQFQSSGFDSANWGHNRTVVHITLVGPTGKSYTYLTNGRRSVLVSTK